MIEIRCIKDGYRKDLSWISDCNCCGKHGEDDPDMIDVVFRGKSGHGIVVTLCTECRRELMNAMKGIKA